MRYEDDGRGRIAVTMSQRVNLGNYESADVSICLSGIPTGATEAQIEDMLDTSHLAYKSIRARLGAKVRELREEARRAREFREENHGGY